MSKNSYEVRRREGFGAKIWLTLIPKKTTNQKYIKQPGDHAAMPHIDAKKTIQRCNMDAEDDQVLK